MLRAMLMALFLAPALMVGSLLAARPAMAQADQQDLVDRSTLTVQELLRDGPDDGDLKTLLRRAKGVMVCPRILRAGFIFGAEGGGCVMLGRDGNGSWSSPAFYGMGSGSFGLQIGLQDMEVMLLILTDKGLNALLDSQFKLGADASIALATIGGSVQGATTAAVGADIVAMARNRGLYAGVSLSGSLFSARSSWNQAYYGRPLDTRQIIQAMDAHNPGADPLRAILTRYSAPQAGAAPLTSPPPPPMGNAPGAYVPPGSSGGVESSPLPPVGGRR